MTGIYKSGEINAIYDKWFLTPIPPKGVNLNVPMSAAFKKVVANPTDSGDPKDYQVVSGSTQTLRRGFKPRRNCVLGGRRPHELQLELGDLLRSCRPTAPAPTCTPAGRRRLDARDCAAAWVIALSVGSVVGVIRTTPVPWLVRLGNAYVELFRNIPLLVQMFLWYFVLPEVMPQAIGDWLKQSANASFYNAVLCLGLYTSARVAEQVKAGILAARGQRMAGLAMGLTLPQTYRYVLLPMAFRIILPPLTSEFLNIIKNSSVALTIGLIELTAAARSMQEFTFQVFEAFTAATMIYIVVNVVVVAGMRWLERRVACPASSAWARLRRRIEGTDDVCQFRLGRHRPLAAVPVPRRHDASRSC